MDQTIFNKARRDKFVIVFDVPKALKYKASNVDSLKCRTDLQAYLSNSIQFAIYGTPVPKTSIREVDLAYAGQVHRQTSFTRPVFASLTIGMAIDNNFLNYWLLWSWLNLWNDSKTAYFDLRDIDEAEDFGLKDYATNFTLFGLDEYNNRVISFSYTNVIITDLSEIEFSYRSTEEIGCTATFAFDQMNVELLSPAC